MNPTINTIDLKFQGRVGTIGAYLVPHSHGCILFETGPTSTITNLISGLEQLGYKIQDITDVFLTHIHLDHAGAAGWLARQGIKIHVHENGAPHLVNPEKLLSSAGRLYGDRMEFLWGEFIPISESQIVIMRDQDVYQIGGQAILALDVPGHASHHLVYLVGDACFSGDIGGIRLNKQSYVRLPMPPPDSHLEKWRGSITLIQHHQPKRIIPTHFGIYPDAEWHLQTVLNLLDEVQAWMEARLASDPTLEELRQQFIEYEGLGALKYGLDEEAILSQQIANPSFMSADGIMRYWNKYRKTVSES